MSVRFHDGNVREFLRACLEGRRAELARLGALVQGGRLIDEILADLDKWAREESGRLLKLSDASRACGYTADHLRVLIRAGKLPDYGRPHALTLGALALFLFVLRVGWPRVGAED